MSDTPDLAAIKARAKVEALLEARDAARANWRAAEGMGVDVQRHWAGVAGWLRHRADRIAAGEGPDWPDAASSTADEPPFTFPVTTGQVTSGEPPLGVSDETRRRLDEMQRVRDRGAAEGAGFYVGGAP